MNTEKDISRRELVATIAGGATLGAIWGAAFPVVASEQRPSIAVVGERNSQLALIDSGSARALLFIGEPDADLLDQLPAMMTMFRQRIDLVIGGERPLLDHLGPLAERWRITHAVVPHSTSEAISLPVSTTIVTTTQRISLSQQISLSMKVGHRNEWTAPSSIRPSALWSLELSSPSTTVAFTPDVLTFAVNAPGPASLLITPNAPEREVRAIAPPGAMAVNYDSESIASPVEEKEHVTRVFPRDIARFILGNDGVELPEWTIPATEGVSG